MKVDRRLRIIGLVLAVFGFCVTTYLTYIHYAGIKPVCGVTHGCETVLTSHYSKLLGVPLSIYGQIGYAAMFVGLLIDNEVGKIVATFFALTGFGQSAYLFYREVHTLNAFCQWCLVSGVVMTIMLVLTTYRLLRDPALADDEPVPA